MDLKGEWAVVEKKERIALVRAAEGPEKEMQDRVLVARARGLVKSYSQTI